MNNNDYRYYILPKTHHKMLKQLLKDTIDILEKEEITYFAEGGTLLNCIRGVDTMLHDDDIDLGCLCSQRPKLLKALKKINQKYDIEYNTNCIKIFVRGQWVHNGVQVFGTPTLDIFFYEKKNDEFSIYSPFLKSKYPACKYKRNDLFPLKKSYCFGDIEINIPNNPMNYLNNMYPDWEKTVVVQIRGHPTDDLINIKDKTISFPIEKIREIIKLI